MESRWQMCRDASEGEYAIHEAGVKYLPKLHDELVEDYEKRKKMTPFFNATWRTIAGLRGMLFRKPPVIEYPTAFEQFVLNVDNAVTPLVRFANDVAEEALEVGRIGLLVDYPPADNVGSLADAQAMGLRGLITTYEAEDILNWRTARINGATVLTMVVLEEDAEIAGDDEFDHKCEDRYRVLDLLNGVYRQRVFRINDKDEDEQVGEDIFPIMNGKKMNFIPFIFIGTDCLEPDIDAPPLIDLVTTNIHHYQISSSYERGCFISGLGTMFVYGYVPDDASPIYMGGAKANCIQNTDARAEFVELKSEFNALRTNLLDKKQEMALLGARMLESQKSGIESAEAIARRQNGDESILSDISQTISMGITITLRWLAMWQGIEGDIKFELNRDFMPSRLTAQELTALFAALQGGGISHQTYFDNLKAGEIIDSDVTFDDEQARINNAAPNMSVMATG